LDGQIIAAAAKHKQQQHGHIMMSSNSPSSKVDTSARGKSHPRSKGGESSSNENNETNNNASQTKVDEKKNYNTTRPKIRQHPEWDECERSTTVAMVPHGSRRGTLFVVCYMYSYVV
jgi:hypothetical protein